MPLTDPLNPSPAPQSGLAAPALVSAFAREILTELHKVIVGQDDVLEQLLTAYLAGGHVLFEGVPGLAKTLMVKALAHCLGSSFSRIQFTPDLLPSDITGTNVYDLSQRAFHFQAGPVFASLILADEINRTPPKTQAALLEAMEERQVSVDGTTHPLPPDFTVFATQNPVEYEGTYPLPEAQLDRFLLKVHVDYPAEREEREVLQRHHAGLNPHDLAAAGVCALSSTQQYAAMRAEVDRIHVEDGVLNYIVSLVRATRAHRSIALGASPRAGVALLRGAKALAAIRGKSYITPDEVQSLAQPVLRHRLLLTPESEIEGGDMAALINAILGSVPVPR